MKKLLPVTYFSACFTMMLLRNASAYLDPSVMTYGIQAVAGVAIAVGAAVGIFWRRAKRKVQDKLGIDENAKKEVEGAIEVFDQDNEKM